MTVHFDGLCEPKNPGGHGCGGWRIVGLPGGEVLGYEHFGKNAYMTNNVAEYRALLSALAALRTAGWAGSVAIRGDSQLVINQLTGKWKANMEHIRDLRDATLSLLKAFSDVEIAWVPREKNSIADALSRKAYAEATGSPPPER